MDLMSVEVSRHAWLRFLKRWQEEPPVSYRDELARLMAAATEEHLGYGTAVRLLKNGCQPARYFRSEKWRFVVDEEMTKVLTIELVYLKQKKPLKRICDKKRHGGKP